MPNYKVQIEAAQQRFYREIEGVAAVARQKYVVPLCKKHDLEFLSGNGDCWFEAPQVPEGEEPHEQIHDGVDAHNEGYEQDEFRDVFKVLNTMVDNRSTLGMWMDSFFRSETD